MNEIPVHEIISGLCVLLVGGVGWWSAVQQDRIQKLEETRMTKEDSENRRAELRADMASSIDELKTDVRRAVAELKTDMRNSVIDLKLDLTAQLRELANRINRP